MFTSLLIKKLIPPMIVQQLQIPQRNTGIKVTSVLLDLVAKAQLPVRLWNPSYSLYVFVSNDTRAGDHVVEAHPDWAQAEYRNLFILKEDDTVPGRYLLFNPAYNEYLFVSNDRSGPDYVVESHSVIHKSEARNRFELIPVRDGTAFRLFNPSYQQYLFVSNDKEGPHDHVVLAHPYADEARNEFELEIPQQLPLVVVRQPPVSAWPFPGAEASWGAWCPYGDDERCALEAMATAFPDDFAPQNAILDHRGFLTNVANVVRGAWTYANVFGRIINGHFERGPIVRAVQNEQQFRAVQNAHQRLGNAVALRVQQQANYASRGQNNTSAYNTHNHMIIVMNRARDAMREELERYRPSHIAPASTQVWHDEL
ncbi:hypothetical protein AMAG_12473 [Allomyces macrogynus ATCC 38327]|uniref:Uncharacterized protein n=1 Tax=Allomyces macrogynus (strain ATCC 38327) TaxID=578462 RepID=A0A0L0SYW2_ALLM3|nr:hypothetical protein AMAG_12473 [Allomyces macrogynus ATCC 38327]|eukprot:KNE67748.1 hypothetical protein AMAG_12473 [Allomyces macrogynus ATCC 38327]